MDFYTWVYNKTYRGQIAEEIMIKAQDCMILLKLLADPEKAWSQRKLARALQISLSEINAGIKRLITAGLLRISVDEVNFVPILGAAEEFLVHSVKGLCPNWVLIIFIFILHTPV